MANLLFVLLLFDSLLPLQSQFAYAAAGVYLLLRIHSIARSVIRIPRINLRDALVLSVLSAWVYGLVVGVLYGNGSNTFINFAGMSLFTVYIVEVIASELSLEKLIRDVVRCAVLLMGLLVFTGLGRITSLDIAGYIGQGTSVFRLYWSSSISLILVLSLVTLMMVVAPKRFRSAFESPWWHWLFTLRHFLLALSTAVVFFSGSKGFIAAYTIAVLSPLIALTVGTALRRSVHMRAYSTTVVLLGVALLGTRNFSEPLGILYALEADDSSVRPQQAAALKAEMSIIGKGLGASLESGYSRDAAGYGFELTYHNLIHKLGIASLAVFGLFGYICVSALLLMVQPKPRLVVAGGVSLALVLFLVPAYGNPILFAPINVVLTCFSLLVQRAVHRDDRKMLSAGSAGDAVIGGQGVELQFTQ